LEKIVGVVDIPKFDRVVESQRNQANFLMDPEDTIDRAFMLAYRHYFSTLHLNGGNITRR